MTRLIKSCGRVLLNVAFFLMGNIIAFFYYDRKYIRGRHFKNGHFGVGAVGWQWICVCFPFQAIFRINSKVPWPVSPQCRVGNPNNILFDPDNLDNFLSPGVYFQSSEARIIIGKGSYIAPNVGLITQNHDVHDPALHAPPKEVVIGEKCWLGMNAVILPGVVLGPHTTVGAGAVVTKSFENGYCVIGGNPAKIIRSLVNPDE